MRSHRCFPRPYGINRFPKPFSRLFVVRWRNRFDEVWRRPESLLVWREYFRKAGFRWVRWRGPCSAIFFTGVFGDVPPALLISWRNGETVCESTTCFAVQAPSRRERVL